MRRVALTGGIATGKSTVARCLRSHGVPVVDADQLARDAVAPGTAALDAVVARFGPGVREPGGGLDRAALGQLVFADADARRDLERILHPVVRVGIDAFYAGLPDGVAGVTEIPLVFETGNQGAFDAVIATACSHDTQRQRLANRDGLDAHAITDRLASQWSVEDKARLADFVIMTDGSLADTERQAGHLVEWLRGGTTSR